jgi:hypothetical protein
MKKLLTVLCTLAVAFSLTMPVLAAQGGQKEAATSSHHHKAHKKHTKKKGATEGQKKGQQGQEPAQK